MVNPEMVKFTERLEGIQIVWKTVAVAALICGFGFGVMVGVIVSKLW